MAKPKHPKTNHIPTTTPVSTYPATLAPHTTAAAERHTVGDCHAAVGNTPHQ